MENVDLKSIGGLSLSKDEGTFCLEAGREGRVGLEPGKEGGKDGQDALS